MIYFFYFLRSNSWSRHFKQTVNKQTTPREYSPPWREQHNEDRAQRGEIMLGDKENGTRLFSIFWGGITFPAISRAQESKTKENEGNQETILEDATRNYEAKRPDKGVAQRRDNTTQSKQLQKHNVRQDRRLKERRGVREREECSQNNAASNTKLDRRQNKSNTNLTEDLEDVKQTRQHKYTQSKTGD